MRNYVVQWRGTITRDVGVERIEAVSVEAAKREFEKQYGWMRSIIAVSLECEE